MTRLYPREKTLADVAIISGCHDRWVYSWGETPEDNDTVPGMVSVQFTVIEDQGERITCALSEYIDGSFIFETGTRRWSA